ncbi:MAG: hypothetical protein NUW01_00005 [Gemmatimonadaceae bacterium]|nr:hypothetical protein [Gemmatimonadaceae bacterium]
MEGLDCCPDHPFHEITCPLWCDPPGRAYDDAVFEAESITTGVPVEELKERRFRRLMDGLMADLHVRMTEIAPPR